MNLRASSSLRQKLTAIPRRKWHLAGLCIYAPLAWLMLLSLPIKPPGVDLEYSWRGVLHHAAVHRWQFGSDIVFTFGPLGYLQSSAIYVRGTFLACILYQLTFKAFYVGLICWLSARLPRKPAVIFLLLNTLLPVLDDDAIYLLTIGYAALVFCGEPRAARRWAAPALAFLAVAALMKMVFLVYAVVMLSCVGAGLLAARRRWEAALLPVGFGLFFVGADLWLGGQRLSSLPGFLRKAPEIVGGYAQGMGAPPSLESWLGGAVLCGIVAARWVWLAFFQHGGETPAAAAAAAQCGRRWALFCVLGAGLFLAWKQGFTRADLTHQMTFFVYAAAIGSAGGLFFTPGCPEKDPPWSWQQAGLVFAPTLTAWTALASVPMCHGDLAARLAANARWLATPAAQYHRMERLTIESNQPLSLPRCRAAVGDATVDLFGCEQSFLLANGFNYRPAPVFQPYTAYTAQLLEINAAFYRSARAPEFVLYRPQIIDERFPNLDNAGALLELIRRYQPLFSENGCLLLRRRSAPAPASAPIHGPLLLEGVLRPGQRLDLPPDTGPLWCEMEIRSNLAGRLAEFFLQPPVCYLNVFTADKAPPFAYRFVPAMARSGFLLTPKIAAPQDLEQLLAGKGGPGQAVEAIGFQPDGLTRRQLQPQIRYRLYPVALAASPTGE